MQQAADKVGAGFDGLRGPIDGVLMRNFVPELLRNKQVANVVRFFRPVFAQSPFHRQIPVMWGWNADDFLTSPCAGLPPTFNVTEQLYNGKLAGDLMEQLGFPAEYVWRVLQARPYSACAVPGSITADIHAVLRSA